MLHRDGLCTLLHSSELLLVAYTSRFLQEEKRESLRADDAMERPGASTPDTFWGGPRVVCLCEILFVFATRTLPLINVPALVPMKGVVDDFRM